MGRFWGRTMSSDCHPTVMSAVMKESRYRCRIGPVRPTVTGCPPDGASREGGFRPLAGFLTLS